MIRTPRSPGLGTGNPGSGTNRVSFSCGIIRPINREYDENSHRSAQHDVHDDVHAHAHPGEADYPLRRYFPDMPIQELPGAALFYYRWSDLVRNMIYQMETISNNQYLISSINHRMNESLSNAVSLSMMMCLMAMCSPNIMRRP